jgi:hypothetical protein
MPQRPAPNTPLLRGLRGLSTLAALLLASSVCAATVYRCGAVYQDRPCGEGQTELNTGAAPSADELAQAQGRAQNQASLARQLVNERRQRERRQQADAQTQPVALSQPHASLSEDNSLTDCKRPPTAKVHWSKRKQEYCAGQKISLPKRRSHD